MKTTRKHITVRVIPFTNNVDDEFDVVKYHDDAISAIINRFKKTSTMKRLDKRFESDFVFSERDALTIVEACFRMNLPFEVGFKPAYDGCWEINFKTLLERK